MHAIDSAIKSAYVDFNTTAEAPVSADDILCDPALEESFWGFFVRRNPVWIAWARSELNRRFLRLRKIGERNGGLPRTTR